MRQTDKTATNLDGADHLLPLSTPVFQVLLSLYEGDRHGYAIIQDIEHRTTGEVSLSTSTLYGAVKRMMRDGLVERSDDRPETASDDERRRYYKITEHGRRVARAEAQRIDRLAKIVRRSQLLTRTP